MISSVWNFFTKSRHQKEYEDLQGALSELDPFDLDDLTRSLGITDGNAIVQPPREFATTAESNKKNAETSSNDTEDDWVLSENEATAEDAMRLEAEGKAMHKIFVGYIDTATFGAVTIQPGGISIKLDNIHCNFVPLRGDNVQLRAMCKADPCSPNLAGKVIKLDYLKPLRSRIVEGRISNWTVNENGIGGYGEIMPTAGSGDRFFEPPEPVYFEQGNCEPGYMPCSGDRVSADCIECHRLGYKWRALIVVSLNALAVKKRHAQDPEEVELLGAVGNVDISKQTNLGRMQFGTAKTLKVMIANTGKHLAVLQAVYPHPRLCCPQPQFSLDESIQLPFKLPVNTKFNLLFNCKAKNLGASKELFVFQIDDKSYGRFLQVEALVEYSANDPPPPKITSKHRVHYTWKPHDVIDDENMVTAPRRGQRLDPFRKRFLHYPVTENAKKLAKDPTVRKGQMAAYEAMYVHFKDFRTDLSPNNYTQRWHDLLHIEEAEITVEMQKFDIQGAKLVHAGKFELDDLYTLDVPGLSENRPSLVLNDTVKVQHIRGGVTYEGIVSKVMLKQVQLRFSDRFEAPKPDDSYLVLFMLNRNSYRRLHAAVDAAWSNLGPSLLFPSTKITIRNPQIMIDDAVTPDERLADGRGSSSSPASRGAGYRGRGRGISRRANPRSRMHGRGPMPQPEQPKEEPQVQTVPHLKKICFINEKLNSSQRAAVRNVLLGRARPLPYIIYGPPGTGKTMTLVETILQLYLVLNDSRLLVATPSNSAADLLAERLLDSGKLMPGAMVRLLAISYEDNVTPRLIPYSRVLKGIGELKNRNTPVAWERIVIGTCATLGKLVQNSRESGGSHFTHVLVDEAGQTTEPETMLVTALLGKPYQTILAGDPMQLGPVVQGRASELGGLGVSFLGRLLGQGPYRRDVSSFPNTQGYNPNLITMLVQNYRSIPEILALPAALFYNSELVATVSQHQGEEATLLAAMKDDLPQRPGQVPPALVFHGVRGVCNREEDSPSWYNDIELYQAAKYITLLYRKGVPHSQIGVISPYNKQVQKMRNLLCKMGLDIPKVGSVEEFQGQERLAIIFSAVRSAENCGEEALGFLANPNRMNTAVTRARALLVVIGDPHLLAMDPSWRSLIVDCIRRNAYCGCDVPSSLLTSTGSNDGSQ